MATTVGLDIGDRAPPFDLPDQDGMRRRLRDFAGGKLVLFFFPRADTPGCTTEAQDFSARLSGFRAAKADIVGISADPPKALARFRTKRDIAVTLLADEAGDVLRAYGVWGEKSMYGKSFEGILRTTMLIGADGRLADIWRKVRVPGHAEMVLNSVRKIP